MPIPHILRLLTLAALLLALGGGPARGVTLKIATISPDGTAWMKELRAAGAEIETRTEGRVKLKFYPGGVMGNERSVLRKIRIGQLHGGAFTSGGLVEVYNDMQIYSIPFLFRSLEEVDYVSKRMNPLLMKGLEERGLVAMGISETGFAHLMSVAPMRTRDDLVGRKMWIPEGDTMSEIALQAGGVSPYQLPISDVYTGLQTGLIDTVASPPVGALAFQWHTKIKYVTDLPLMYLVGALVIGKKPFDRISPADQATMREVIAGLIGSSTEQTRRDNEDAKRALANQGIGFVEPSPDEVGRWRAIANEVLDEYLERDLYTREMYGVLQGHLRDFRSAQAGER